MPKAAFVAMLLIVSYPAEAGEAFYADHLLPRLTRQMQSGPAIEPLPVYGGDATGQAMYEYVLESARFQAERGAKKALKSYLLEVTSLDRVYRSVRGERKSREPRENRAVDCGLRISHGAAKLEVRRRLSSGEFTAGVDTSGGFGLEYDGSERTRLRMRARYDARERSYEFSFRYDF